VDPNGISSTSLAGGARVMHLAHAATSVLLRCVGHHRWGVDNVVLCIGRNGHRVMLPIDRIGQRPGRSIRLGFRMSLPMDVKVRLRRSVGPDRFVGEFTRAHFRRPTYRVQHADRPARRLFASFASSFMGPATGFVMAISRDVARPLRASVPLAELKTKRN
jgi:hypothetical protein